MSNIWVSSKISFRRVSTIEEKIKISRPFIVPEDNLTEWISREAKIENANVVDQTLGYLRGTEDFVSQNLYSTYKKNFT